MNAEEQETFDAEYKGNVTMYLILMIVFGLVSFLFFLAVCCYKKDLQRAIDVIDAAADYIARNKKVLLVPMVHFFITLVVTIIWFGAYLMVASLNEVTVDSNIPQGKTLTWEK